MVILGLTSGIHDTSATLVIDGKVVFATEEERVNREKHSGRFPVKTIELCLQRTGITVDEIDEIAVGMKWEERGKARIEMRASVGTPEHLIEQTKAQAEADFKRQKEVGEIMKNKFGYKGVINFYDHYDSHASAAYFPSPFQSAAVLVLDGAGERSSARIYKAEGTTLKPVFNIDYPNSIGRFYAWITDYLGFRKDSDEGKIMGLAPYGNDSLVEKMRDVVKIKDDNAYEINLEYFTYHKDNTNGMSDKFLEVFGPPREKGEVITEHHKNIAYAAQVVLEEVVLSMAHLAKEITHEDNLCLSGGVALNSVANGKVSEAATFEDVYIYPASGDDGTGTGAALYAYWSKQHEKIFYSENQSPYTGYEASRDEIKKALEAYKLPYEEMNDIYSASAELLMENKIIGWYSGKAEFGPRALGNRSIIADPRDGTNKDRVNAKIKFREEFRPFAPSVLEEEASEYFKMHSSTSPYMIMTFEVITDTIPAVTHVDGSARVQTVSKDQNERYYKLIDAFYKLSGVPVVLNSSFNRADEPIVNTPKQAIEAFLGSDLDALVLGDFLVQK